MKVSAINQFSGDVEGSARALRYSLLKLGQKKAINTYSQELTAHISEALPDTLCNPRDWVLAFPGTGAGAVPNAIKYVTDTLSSNLNIACVGLGKKDTGTGDYAAQSKAQRLNNRHIVLDRSRQADIQDKKIILVDDGIASGVALAKSREVLERYGEVTACFVIADFRTSGDPAYERYLNRLVIDLVGPEFYATLLNSEENFTTSKLVAYFFEDNRRLRAAIGYLSPTALANLVFATFIYFKDRASPYLHLIRNHLKDRQPDMDAAILSRLSGVLTVLTAGVNGGDGQKNQIFDLLSCHKTFRLGMKDFDQACLDVFSLAPASSTPSRTDFSNIQGNRVSR